MLSLRQLNKVVKHLPLSDNMLLLIKQGSEIGDIQTVKQLSDAIAEAGFEGSLILIVKEFTDISSIDEATMNKNGWYKIKSLRERIIRDGKSDDSEEPGGSVPLPDGS